MFVKLENVLLIIWVKFKTVDPISKVYAVLKAPEKIDNKIK